MNIFNIFDPSSSESLSLNWIFLTLNLVFFPNLYWVLFSRWSMTWMLMINYLSNELDLILQKKIYKINFISVFVMIALTNFLGLFSFIFTSSSHLSMNLGLSLPLWMTFMIIGWSMNYNKMLIHQVPMGTPSVLMPFMVLIEFISNIIRPGTLSIRLTANMIAGHLLLTLISNNGNKLFILFSLLMVLTQTLLMLLEMGVSFIQAYVFMILLSLYSQES